MDFKKAIVIIALIFFASFLLYCIYGLDKRSNNIKQIEARLEIIEDKADQLGEIEIGGIKLKDAIE